MRFIKQTTMQGRNKLRNKFKINLTRNVIICIVVVIGLVALVSEIQVQSYIQKYDCKETGSQRMVNTVDGVKVEDQYRCNNGEVFWRIK